jgi:hypothetical protein
MRTATCYMSSSTAASISFTSKSDAAMAPGAVSATVKLYASGKLVGTAPVSLPAGSLGPGKGTGVVIFTTATATSCRVTPA